MHLLHYLASDSTVQTADGDDVVLEELHALLADTRRRHMIEALADAGTGTIVDVDELVQDIATRTGTDAENECQPPICISTRRYRRGRDRATRAGTTRRYRV